jgi:hypothetical protein
MRKKIHTSDRKATANEDPRKKGNTKIEATPKQ